MSDSGPNLAPLRVLAAVLFLPSTAWAWIILSVNFMDSSGLPSSRSLDATLTVYAVGLPPLLLCTLVLVWLRDRRGLLTWLACLPVFAAVAALDKDTGFTIRVAGPLLLTAIVLVWRDRLAPKTM